MFVETMFVYILCVCFCCTASKNHPVAMCVVKFYIIVIIALCKILYVTFICSIYIL